MISLKRDIIFHKSHLSSKRHQNVIKKEPQMTPNGARGAKRTVQDPPKNNTRNKHEKDTSKDLEEKSADPWNDSDREPTPPPDPLPI